MLRTVETSWISLQLFIIRRTSALVIVRTSLWTISFTFPHGSAVSNHVEGKQYARRDPVANPSTLLQINLEQQGHRPVDGRHHGGVCQLDVAHRNRPWVLLYHGE